MRRKIDETDRQIKFNRSRGSVEKEATHAERQGGVNDVFTRNSKDGTS